MKRVAVICLLASVLTACGDRERINCPRVKNQIMTRTTTDPTTTTSTLDYGDRCA